MSAMDALRCVTIGVSLVTINSEYFQLVELLNQRTNVVISGWDTLYPLPGFPIEQVLVGTHVCGLVKNRIIVALILSSTPED